MREYDEILELKRGIFITAYRAVPAALRLRLQKRAY